MAKPIHLNQDLREFLRLLNAKRARYLVVGGYAVAAHGHPRNTQDMDIWFEMSEKNADRLLRVLDEFGFGALDITRADFLKPDWVVQLGYPPNRIDLLSSASGIKFAECYARRVIIRVEGVAVHFIDLASLKRNKLASGRKQDLADVEALSEGATARRSRPRG